MPVREPCELQRQPVWRRSRADVDRPTGRRRELEQRVNKAVREIKSLQPRVELQGARAGVVRAAQYLEGLVAEPRARDGVGQQPAARGGRGRSDELVSLPVLDRQEGLRGRDQCDVDASRSIESTSASAESSTSRFAPIVACPSTTVTEKVVPVRTRRTPAPRCSPSVRWRARERSRVPVRRPRRAPRRASRRADRAPPTSERLT